MPGENAFLERVHIKNFLSLHDVEFPLKPLTVLVGPNASGKSNILNALRLLNRMMVAEEFPLVEIRDSLWAGKMNQITFQIQAKAKESQTAYKLDLEAEADNPIVAEELLISSVRVISIQKGRGKVQDEDSKNETPYQSNKLALKSAGDYGNKPITRILTEFVKGWEFYDFQPDFMRRYFEVFPIFPREMRNKSKERQKISKAR